MHAKLDEQSCTCRCYRGKWDGDEVRIVIPCGRLMQPHVDCAAPLQPSSAYLIEQAAWHAAIKQAVKRRANTNFIMAMRVPGMNADIGVGPEQAHESERDTLHRSTCHTTNDKH